MTFTIFVENDFVRIVKYLGLNPQSVDGEEFVRLQMRSTEDSYPSLVPTIQSDLTTLDTLDTAMTAERQSSNSALIKADVLAWSDRPGSRTEGMAQEFERIKSRVASMLGLEVGGGNGGQGMGCLMRG